MQGTIEQIAVAMAVLGVMVVAGLPLTALALPGAWRPFWPAVLPVAGFITLVCVAAPLNAVLPLADARLPLAALLVAGVAVALWRRPRPLPRPSLAAGAAIAVALAAGSLVFAPSLSAGRAVPPAIVSADAFYYAITSTWLEEHTSRAVPPDPAADSFFTPAFVADRAPLSLGAEQVNTAIAVLFGLDPSTVLPAYVAILAALGFLVVGLVLAALGVAPAFAAGAVLLVAARSDGVRIALDAAVAQLCGTVTLPVVVVAAWLWIRRGDRAWLAWAILAAAALAAAYPGYVPFAVLAIGGALAFSVLWPDAAGIEGPRSAIFGRAADVIAGTLIVSLPHALRTADALLNVNSVSEFDIGGFRPATSGLTLLAGTSDVYADPGGLDVAIAILVVAGAAWGVASLWRAGHRAIVAGVAAAVGIYLIRLRFIDPYPHGLEKFWNLPGPLLAGLLAAGLAVAGRRMRVALGAVAAAVVVLGVINHADLVERSLASPYAPSAAESALRSDARLFPDGRAPIALDGTSHDGEPMGRLHWAAYALRTGQGADVGYEVHLSYLLSAVYENPRVYVPQRGDEAYRPDYAYVLSYGPSATHDTPYLEVGPYAAYRRVPVDLLLAGWAWSAPEATRSGPVWWWQPARGPAAIRVSSSTSQPARFTLRLVADRARSVRIRLDGRTIATARIGARPATVRTRAVPLSAGRHDLEIVPVGGTPGPRSIGLLRARATTG